MQKLLIFGASGHAKVIHEIARLRGVEVIAFAESQPKNRAFAGLPVLSEARVLDDPPCDSAVVAIGDPRIRKAITERLQQRGLRIMTLIHPGAIVSSDVILSDGTVVMAGAVINPGCEIGRGAIINTNASVDHDCRIGDYAHVCPAAALGGAVRVGTGGWIGINATVIQGVSVGDWTMVGAGAVVVRDLPAEVVAYGVPAVVARSECFFRALPDVESSLPALPETPSEETAKVVGELQVRQTVKHVIHEILTDSGRTPSTFADDDALMGAIGLDSLDLAVMTVTLEQRVGVDPFRNGRGAVRSFGELVAVYEEAVRGQS